MSGTVRAEQAVVRELFGMDVRRFLADSRINPDTVDTEAVAADLYQQHGHTNLEAMTTSAFWTAVNRHTNQEQQ